MPRTEHVYKAPTNERIKISAPDDFPAPDQISFTRQGVPIVFTPFTAAAKPVAQAGKRLADDWQPSAELLAWAKENTPSADLVTELAQMKDWSNSVAASRGAKTDWDRAWKNWMRTAHRRNVERGWKPSPIVPPAKALTAGDARAQWLAEHGVTEAEWEKNKGDRAWLDRITRRGHVD